MDKNSYRIALAIKLDGTATGCLNAGYGQQLHDLLKEASRALLDSNDAPSVQHDEALAKDAARYRWLKHYMPERILSMFNDPTPGLDALIDSASGYDEVGERPASPTAASGEEQK